MNSEPSPVVSAAASPPSRFRRLFQISLRTFFVLLTISCIGLGVLTKRARDQRAAVDRILELGGSVTFDYEFDQTGRRIEDAQPQGWRWLRQQIGDEYFRDVVRVNLDKTAVTDDDLRLIGKLHATKSLALNWTQVSDAGLVHIRHMRQLNYLGLAKTRVTDQGLRHIEHMDKLDTLILGNMDVGDGAISFINELNQLQTLNLQSTGVTAQGIGRLAPHSKLANLYLDRTCVDDTMIESLSSRKSLLQLSIEGTQVSGQGLLRLRDTLPTCRIDGEFVNLSRERFGEDPKSMSDWADFVKRLTLLNDERRLKLIDLSGSQITDRYLPDLESLNHVEVIDLRDTKVTDDGVEALRQVLPKCKVER